MVMVLIPDNIWQIVYIGKKYFRTGRLALPEWNHSIRAVRDTPGADYSALGIKSPHRVAYGPLITVPLFLLTLSVSYFKRTVRRCGQLWLYIGMGSLGTDLHQDCNEKGDAVKISPRIHSTGAQNAILPLLIIHIIPSCQIYVAIDNP